MRIMRKYLSIDYCLAQGVSLTQYGIFFPITILTKNISIGLTDIEYILDTKIMVGASRHLYLVQPSIYTFPRGLEVIQLGVISDEEVKRYDFIDSSIKHLILNTDTMDITSGVNTETRSIDDILRMIINIKGYEPNILSMYMINDKPTILTKVGDIYALEQFSLDGRSFIISLGDMEVMDDGTE